MVEDLGAVSRAEDLALGGMLENRKTGERLGITCVKVQETAVADRKVKSCTELQFYRANAADQELAIQLIGPKYTPQSVRDRLNQANGYEELNAYDTSTQGYVGFCTGRDHLDGVCSSLNPNVPIYGFELTAAHAVAVSMADSAAWYVLYAFLPVTFAIDIAKDLIADSVALGAVGLADFGLLAYNAGNEVVVASKNAAHRAAAARANRKFARAVVTALAHSKKGASIRIAPHTFNDMVSYLSQCENEGDFRQCSYKVVY